MFALKVSNFLAFGSGLVAPVSQVVHGAFSGFGSRSGGAEVVLQLRSLRVQNCDCSHSHALRPKRVLLCTLRWIVARATFP